MDDGHLVTGIYRKGTHKLIPVRSCPLEDERAGRILETIRSLCTRFGIIAYDEDMGFGDLRHVLIRLAAHNDEALVTLVTASDRLPHEADLAAAIHQKAARPDGKQETSPFRKKNRNPLFLSQKRQQKKTLMKILLKRSASICL